MTTFLKILFIFFSITLLVYMLLPGPSAIADFPALPNSVKSELEGDTIQVPNVAAYFSYNYRDFVIPYYNYFYFKNTQLPFVPIRLNYPPEFAYTAIKDQTHSTYLEELVYPLRDSIFINGFEPFYQEGQPKFEGASKIGIHGIDYDTKVTLRYYSSPLWVKIIVWIGINISVIGLFFISKKAIFEKDI